jgi:hypothetical protein
MVKPVRGFRDPLSAAKLDVDDELAIVRALPDVPEYLDDLVASTAMPLTAPVGPLLVVRQGPWTDYQSPLTAVCRVRFVAWHSDPDTAYDIADWAHARLLARAGDADVHSYRYDSGPLRGRDPDFPDSPLAAFALRVRMRPAIL